MTDKSIRQRVFDRLDKIVEKHENERIEMEKSVQHRREVYDAKKVNFEKYKWGNKQSYIGPEITHVIRANFTI
jgi:flagellar biosynthesis chaperone FliJ